MVAVTLVEVAGGGVLVAAGGLDPDPPPAFVVDPLLGMGQDRASQPAGLEVAMDDNPIKIIAGLRAGNRPIAGIATGPAGRLGENEVVAAGRALGEARRPAPQRWRLPPG